jgi:hypothetical protein
VTDTSISDLVALALFDLDPRTAQAQQPLHTFLVSLALFGAPGGLTKSDVAEAVRALLPLEPNMLEADVEAAVELHLQNGLAIEEGGVVTLSPERRTQLGDAAARLAAKKTAFHRHMASAVDARAPLNDGEENELLLRLENQLVELLQLQSAVVAAAWSPGGQGFDSALQELNAREHLAEIANAMAGGGAAVSKLRRGAIALGLEDGFLTLPEDAAGYLGALYQRTVALALLEQDPHLRAIKSRLAKDRIAYLDANVVLAAMFEASGRKYEVSCQVLEITRALGAELRITRFTYEEIVQRIEDASRWMKSYKGREDLRGVVDDFIVRAYHRATRDAAGYEWSAFIGGFNPPDAWLAERGITVDDKQVCSETEADSRVDDVRATIGAFRKEGTPTVVLQTDALNIVHVDRQRRSVQKDELGSRVWLVTLDRGLAKAERQLVERQAFASGASRLADDWVDLLGPCIAPDEGRLAGYVTQLVQSQFGLLAEDPLFVEKQFLLTLQRSRFRISEVLGASTDRARQILVKLQESAEIENLLRAPEPDDSAWNEQLELAVEAALAALDASPETASMIEGERQARSEAEAKAEQEQEQRNQALRDLAEVRGTTAALRDEGRQTKQERDDLAQRVSTVESVSWWRRLLKKY